MPAEGLDADRADASAPPPGARPKAGGGLPDPGPDPADAPAPPQPDSWESFFKDAEVERERAMRHAARNRKPAE